LRPSTRMACSASPVQISFGRVASNRPDTGAACGVTIAVSPVRWNIRWIVRSSGAHPDWALRIRWTCAAVRAGFSFFSAAASAITSGGVRGWDRRGDGTSASNPPCRHARIHTSSVHRVTRTGCPDGPSCSRAAISRTMTRLIPPLRQRRSTAMAVLESRDHQAARERLKGNPVIAMMAAGVVTVPLAELADEDGTPRSHLMNQANRAFDDAEARNAGNPAYEPYPKDTHRHLGLIAEAVLAERAAMRAAVASAVAPPGTDPESAAVTSMIERMRTGESAVAIARETGAVREPGPGEPEGRDTR
jgi:hypothetical protein